MRTVAAGMYKRNTRISLAVIGGTQDDLGLMRIGDTFVSGPVETAELPFLCRAYDVDALLLCATRPVFGHPVELAARAASLPLAYFDWSNGYRSPCSCDLVLNPGQSAADLIDTLHQWLKAG
jgi:hypothetical protein